MNHKAKRLLSAISAAALAFSLFAAAPLTSEAADLKSSPGNVGPRANSGNDPANGIYVSPSGNDSTATGSSDKPYKSINAALEAAKPGATVILRSGTYREGINVRIKKPNITIKSAKGEWAVIDLTDYTRATMKTRASTLTLILQVASCRTSR